MKISEKLRKIASSLESVDNEVLVSAERNTNDVLAIVAQALACAADELRIAADKVESEEVVIDKDSLNMIASLASEYDGTTDPDLQKVASVLDEILLTIGADKDAKKKFKLAEQTELDRIRTENRAKALETYYNVKNENNVKASEEAEKAIKEKVKEYKPLQHSLSTRYSPDMPGVSLVRIGDNVYQCPVTGKIYDFTNGYTTAEGDKVPGGSVSNQTQQLGYANSGRANFNSRQEALNNKAM